MRRLAILLTAVVVPAAASAQIRLPIPIPGRGAPVPAAPPIELLRAEFVAQSGATTVYFGAGSAALSPQGKAVLAAQALWLRRNPAIAVRIEGHGDGGDTRDHAIALGARRAAEVRDYLVLLGVPAAQVTAMSWGSERPGAGRAVTTLVP
jgi:peptidoglycan-associated lipoprotein